MDEPHQPPEPHDPGPAGAHDWRRWHPGATATEPPPAPGARRRLPLVHGWRVVRGDDGVVAGVCTGIARATGVDVALVRVAFVLAALSGVGLIAYVALWILAPREDRAAGVVVEVAPPEAARVVRIALAIGAIVGITSSLGEWPYSGFPLEGPGGALGLMLIGAGAAVLLARRGDRVGGLIRPLPGDGGAVAAAPAPPAPPTPPPAPTPPSAPMGDDQVDLAKPAPAHREPADHRIDHRVDDPWPAPPAGGGRRGLVDRIRRHAWRVTLTRAFAGACAVLGSLAMLTLVVLDGSGALSVGAPLLVGVLLVVGTVGVIATAAVAPPSWPTLAAAAVLLGGGLLGAATSDWAGHVGDRDVVVTRADQLADRYDLAIGALTLDLSDLELAPAADDVTVAVRAGIGRVDVIVPDDVRLVAEAHVSIGEVDVPRDATSGLAVGSGVDDPGVGSGGVVRLDLDGGIGEIVVCRAADAQPDGERCA